MIDTSFNYCMKNKINKDYNRNQENNIRIGNSSAKDGDAPDKVTMGHNSFLH